MNRTDSDKLFQNAFHFAAIGMALVGLDGRWLRVNGAACELLGYTEEELLLLTFQEITHPEDLDLDLTHLGELLRGEIANYQMEKRYFHKGGHVIWASLYVSLVRDAQGEPEVFISQLKDITMQKAAELVRENFFKIPLVLHYVAGFDGHFRQLSKSWTDVLGHSLESLMAAPYLDFVHPEDRVRTQIASSELAAGRNVFLFENRYLHQDGSYRWLLWACVSVTDQSAISGVALDYTSRKQTELELERTLRQMERLVGDLRASEVAINTLRQGLLTVCAWTHRVQHEGRWLSLSEFLRDHLKLNLTHGISEEAMQKMLGEAEKERSQGAAPEAAL